MSGLGSISDAGKDLRRKMVNEGISGSFSSAILGGPEKTETPSDGFPFVFLTQG